MNRTRVYIPTRISLNLDFTYKRYSLLYVNKIWNNAKHLEGNTPDKFGIYLNKQTPLYGPAIKQGVVHHPNLLH